MENVGQTNDTGSSVADNGGEGSGSADNGGEGLGNKSASSNSVDGDGRGAMPVLK